MNRPEQLERLLKERIAIIDGAMGTTIRTYGKKEADIRGTRFADSKKDLLNKGDLFSLTHKEMICDINISFLEAGADIIETNTFGSTAIAQADFGLEAFVYELNLEAARIAREAADAWISKTPARPRFVAGAMGPTNRTLSIVRIWSRTICPSFP